MFVLIIAFSVIALIIGLVSYWLLVTGWHEVNGILEERNRRKKDMRYQKILRAI